MIMMMVVVVMLMLMIIIHELNFTVDTLNTALRKIYEA